MKHKEFNTHLKSFVDFTCDKLGIQEKPNIKFKTPEEQGEQPSFASYSPSTKEVTIMTKNRHPMDIFRSIAHELIHHKQNEDGRLGHDADEGSTGSDIENEANSEAGKVMRWFAKANPSMFEKSHVTESLDHTIIVGSKEWNSLSHHDKKKLLKVGTKKTHSNSDYEKIGANPLNEGVNDKAIFKAVFLAGGVGSGKDYILHKCIDGNGLTELNSDKAFEFLLRKNNLSLTMSDDERHTRDIVRGRAKNINTRQKELYLGGRTGVIINGTADEFAKISRLKQEYEALGYDTMMVFVNTSNKTSRQRNISRGERGGRTVPEKIRFTKWRGSITNKDNFKRLFGNNFIEVDNSADLRTADEATRAKYNNLHVQVFRKVRQFVNTPVKNPKALAWIASQKRLRGISEMDEKLQKLINEVGGAGNWGTPQLTDRYKRDTPGETPGKTHQMEYHDPKMNKKIGTAPNVVKGNKVKVFGELPIKGDRVGDTYTSAKNPSFVGNQTGDESPYTPYEPFSKWSPVDRWSMNEETKRRFKERYGKLAEQKIQDTVKKLKKESLDDPYSGGMGCTPNASNIEDNRPDINAEFEKTSLFKKQKKTKYNRNKSN